jgi:hypothetical protein
MSEVRYEANDDGRSDRIRVDDRRSGTESKHDDEQRRGGLDGHDYSDRVSAGRFTVGRKYYSVDRNDRFDERVRELRARERNDGQRQREFDWRDELNDGGNDREHNCRDDGW